MKSVTDRFGIHFLPCRIGHRRNEVALTEEDLMVVSF